jgi:hypothetical protein
MSKTTKNPAPLPRTRLIVVGGAKARTNALVGAISQELDPGLFYDPA